MGMPPSDGKVGSGMKPTDKITLGPAMRAVLGLTADDCTAGNVMSHALRETYATGRDPFAGMNYGWADEDEDTLEFVVGLVDLVDSYDNTDDDIGDRDWHDDADSAVPIYTNAIWNVAKRLREFVDEDEVRELAGDGGDDGIEQVMMIGLYTVAQQILETLAGKMADEMAEDDEADEDGEGGE